MRPAASASLKRLHTTRPWERSNSAPINESAARSRIVRGAPRAGPTTWMITYSSANGTAMKTAISPRRGTLSTLLPCIHAHRRGRRRGPDQRDRPRARARLRRAGAGLRDRGRGRGGVRHLHPHLARLPNRPAGDRADGGVRGGARRRLAGVSEDGLRAALDARDDERGREVRPWLLRLDLA